MDEFKKVERCVITAWLEAGFHLELAQDAIRNGFEGLAILEICEAKKVMDSSLEKEGFCLPVVTASTRLESEPVKLPGPDKETDETITDILREVYTKPNDDLLDRLAGKNLKEPESEA